MFVLKHSKWYQENSHQENSHQSNFLLVNSLPENFYPDRIFQHRIFPPMILNSPTHIFIFFVFSLISPLSWIQLKRLFCNSIFYSKNAEVSLAAVYKNFVACRPKWLQTYKKFCWLNMIISHCYIICLSWTFLSLKVLMRNVMLLNSVKLIK